MKTIVPCKECHTEPCICIELLKEELAKERQAYVYLDAENQRLRQQYMDCFETLKDSEAAYQHLREGVDKLRSVLGGCSACDYDETDGGLYAHCDDCCRKITTEAWLLCSNQMWEGGSDG